MVICICTFGHVAELFKHFLQAQGFDQYELKLLLKNAKKKKVCHAVLLFVQNRTLVMLPLTEKKKSVCL